jgi:hypothetical protein
MAPPTLLDSPRSADRALLLAALLILLVGLVSALLSGLQEQTSTVGTAAPLPAAAEPAPAH